MATRTRPTLVECLVVVAIVGTLIGLLLPAQQAARSTARRAASDYASAPAAEVLADSANGRAANRGLVSDAYAALDGDHGGITLATSERRIIYEANVTVVVEELDALATTISARLKEVGGFIADSSVAGAQGEQRSGTWRLRVPVAEFDAFLAAIETAGVVENVRQTAQDVSEEYVDLQARIANQQQLEERIIKLLDSTDDKIADIIQVEQQLARVRGEIERMQGRLRYLSNRVELTTITITAREEHDYVPPVAPTFANQITAAWGNSLAALAEFGQRLTLAVVAATPWLAIIAAVTLPAAWLLRRRRQRSTPTAG
ncbi:MAG: hypothetical protein CMJ58_07485 [Planctomycetaceae bacterium]|nr:hypothetical protein [Planctomycetaceae bacterium]